MPFVQAKCINCGAVLEVDNSKEVAICRYCGTPYIVGKAVNNYNITHKNYIKANSLNIGTESAEQLSQTGMRSLESGNYNLASHCFEKIEENYPSDFRGPWGYVLCHTYNLEAVCSNGYLSERVFEKYKNAYMLAPKSCKEEMQKKFDAYCVKVNEMRRNREEEEQVAAKLKAKKEEEEKKIKEYEILSKEYKSAQEWVIKNKEDLKKLNSAILVSYVVPILMWIFLVPLIPIIANSGIGELSVLIVIVYFYFSAIVTIKYKESREKKVKERDWVKGSLFNWEEKKRNLYEKL